MASKPTDLPVWGTSADIVEPSAGKKDVGWASSERPPNSYFNWFWNLLYQWTQYLDESTIVETHSPSEGSGDTNPPTGDIWTGSDGEFLYMPLRGKVGDELNEVIGYFNDTSGSSVDMRIWKRTMTAVTAAVQIGSTQSTTGAGDGYVQLTVTGLTETFADGFAYWVEIEGDTGAVTESQFLGLKTTRTRKVLA
jgi:hypothetical protein